MLDALPGTTLPIYPGFGQTPNVLACIPGGLVNVLISPSQKTGIGANAIYSNTVSVSGC